ncbi:hypothetical protein [Kitasatospora sp. NPDC088346]|uniref:hypothetical protein n=1 Tax=Kitasatospora sp. NPDC088346 TaxID=3364073 RepID=UPI003804FF62
MTSFSCANCRQPLTGELTQARLAPNAERRPGRRAAPLRAVRGSYLTSADGGSVILHPEDVRGTAPHPDDGRRNGCCGLDGLDGPNLVCAGCGADIATEQSDCWTAHLVVLTAAAVAAGAGHRS